MAFLENLLTGNISPWLLFLFVVVVIWSAVWKLIALWKSARKKDLVWFIILGIVNTLGILEILYIYVFSKDRKITNIKKKK
jgi:predicted membrane channel-forming protein YqfA (hemolysin III family)